MNEDRNLYCCLIIRNAVASLVEIESRDRQYTRPRVQYESVNDAFLAYDIALQRRLLHLKSVIEI